MIIHESAENYLETILILSGKIQHVRSVDIANELGFKKSSVSIAMKNLRENQHIVVSSAGFITLTESGRQIAEMIFERHELISSWLMKIGVSEETALEDAGFHLITDADGGAPVCLSGEQLCDGGFAVEMPEKRSAKIYFYKKG